MGPLPSRRLGVVLWWISFFLLFFSFDAQFGCVSVLARRGCCRPTGGGRARRPRRHMGALGERRVSASGPIPWGERFHSYLLSLSEAAYSAPFFRPPPHPISQSSVVLPVAQMWASRQNPPVLLRLPREGWDLSGVSAGGRWHPDANPGLPLLENAWNVNTS